MSLHVTTHADAAAFLEHTQTALESNEPANGLILGVCARLVRHPERIGATPCLRTVQDDNGLVLAAMITPPHNLVVYGQRGDMEAAARLLAAELLRERWPVPGVLGPAQVARLVVGRLAQAAGWRYTLRTGLRVYECRSVQTPMPGRGRLRSAASAEVGLAARWWHAFAQETEQETDQAAADRAAAQRIADGDLFFWDDGEPVSMACRTRPTRNGISIGPVYTPPEMRGRGNATACVGELSRFLLASGYSFCALFANRDNPVAVHVYEHIGFRPVCDYDEYAFGN
jgi:hypothetical protein